jgi:serine/threonine protein kinase
VRVHRRLSHTGVIKVFEVVDTDAHMLLVLEHAPNGSLLDYVRSRKRLSEAESAYFLQQLVAGLQYCHACEVRRCCRLRVGLTTLTAVDHCLATPAAAAAAASAAALIHCCMLASLITQ